MLTEALLAREGDLAVTSVTPTEVLEKHPLDLAWTGTAPTLRPLEETLRIYFCSNCASVCSIFLSLRASVPLDGY